MPKPAKTDRPALTAPDAIHTPAMFRVWDPLVRLFHWSLVLSFAIAWLTPHGHTAALHHWAGYGAAGLIGLRLVWGILGSRYARFTQFVHRPRLILGYLKDIGHGNAARYVGHNPAGGVMVLLLLAGMGVTVLTGWMMTTDRYFGITWVENAHSLAARGMLVLVLLHLSGVALASWQHRENLVRAMITGLKRRD